MSEPLKPLPKVVYKSGFEQGFFVYLVEALRDFKRWAGVAQFDVTRKFSQTGLGPWWSVISTITFVLVIWAIYAQALGAEKAYYLRHIFIGYLAWIFIADNISQGSNLFVSQYAIFSQIRVNSFGLVLKWLLGRLFIFSRHIYLLPALFFLGDFSGFNLFALSLIPAFALLLINSFALAYTLSVLSAAYRDLPFLVPVLMRFFFFATPIIWDESNLNGGIKLIFAHYNPFYYFIELFRMPLIEGTLSLQIWAVALGLSLFNLIVMRLVYKLFNHRIIYLAM
jgi:ABC-type polysaccharide/polyol phosphate export permease